MLLHQNFIGGNISVKGFKDNVFVLDNEMRDTVGDWFYWAFCIEGAENQELTFKFDKNRLGYFGPAVSHDLINWRWLDGVDGDSFTYKFSSDENKVYFAHNMLYLPQRFYGFTKNNNLEIKELCKGYKGASVPCLELGSGSLSVVLTARHHACESTGNYVLEGVLSELVDFPVSDLRILCVPFVDYEGVIRGDQGKNRYPHDHNRDYSESEFIYPECRAIKEYVEKYGCNFCFDFHSPWHKGDQNDTAFIVQNSFEKINCLNLFGRLFESNITKESFNYQHSNDYPPFTGWNKGGAMLSNYLSERSENNISFALETAYFGTPENKVSADRLIELGRCFAKTIKQYIKI